jgi:hypothetical protein
MSDYVGFFVRDNLGQTPNQPGDSWSSSPDIIFNGHRQLGGLPGTSGSRSGT